MKLLHHETTSEDAGDQSMATHSVLPAEQGVETTVGTSVDEILCPICRRRLFSRNAAVIRLRTRILVFDGDSAYAKCKYCRSDVIVPLVMDESLDEEWLPVWNEGLDGRTR